MSGNGENARTSRIRPVRQCNRLANRMPKQSSNIRVSVSVWVWVCEYCCVSVWRARVCSPCSVWFVWPALAFRCIHSTFTFIHKHREHGELREFRNARAGRSLEIADCSCSCILASCFLGPFLSVSVLFWHAQRQRLRLRQSRLQFASTSRRTSESNGSFPLLQKYPVIVAQQHNKYTRLE